MANGSRIDRIASWSAIATLAVAIYLLGSLVITEGKKLMGAIDALSSSEAARDSSWKTEEDAQFLHLESAIDDLAADHKRLLELAARHDGRHSAAAQE